MVGLWRTVFVLVIGCHLVACTPSDPIEQWIEDLRSNYGFQREQACRKLGNLKSEGARAIPAFRKVLRTDQNNYVRRCAADALGKMGKGALAALPELVGALRDRSGGVRMAAAEAIGKMKEKALPTLRRIIKGKDGHAQLYALRALIHLGVKALPLLEKAARSPFLEVRKNAAESIVTIGRKLQKKKDTPDIRKAREKIVKTLSILLKTPHIKLRAYIIWSLSELGPTGALHSRSTCEILLQSIDDILSNAPNQVKMYAAYALRQMGKKAKKEASLRGDMAQSKTWPQTLTKLRLFLKDETWYIRKHAASALSAWLDALRPKSLQLKTKQQEIFTKRYQKHLSLTIDALKQVLSDPAWDVRYEAARALRKINGVAAWKAFLQVLNSKKPRLREYIVQTIGWMGKAAKNKQSFPNILAAAVLPALKKKLNDPDPKVRKAVEKALSNIGEPAFLTVIRLFNRAKGKKLLQPIRILEGMGKGAKGAAHLFEQRLLLKRQTPHIRQALNRALQKIAPYSLKKARSLLAQLKNTQGIQQRHAALLLGRATVIQKEAIRALNKATKNSDLILWSNAVEALGHLGARLPLSALQDLIGRWPQLKKSSHKASLLYALGLLNRTFLPEVLPLLQRSVPSSILTLRRSAIATIIRWYPHPALAPLLIKALLDKNEEIFLQATKALTHTLPLSSKPNGKRNFLLTRTKILPALLKVTKARNAKRRIAALKTLSSYGLAYSDTTTPALMRAVKDKNAKVRAEACSLLGWLLSTFIVHGWKGVLIQKSLRNAGGPYTYKQLYAIKIEDQKKAGKIRRGVMKKYQLTIDPQLSIERIADRAQALLQTALNDKSAYVRRNAVFALGHTGKYVYPARKKAILHILLKHVKKNKKRFVKRNLCMLLGQWISHDENEAIVLALKTVQFDSGQSRETREQCKTAVRQLRSDDKPYVLWVNHPRSPTLEAFSPTIFHPNGP